MIKMGIPTDANADVAHHMCADRTSLYLVSPATEPVIWDWDQISQEEFIEVIHGRGLYVLNPKKERTYFRFISQTKTR